VQARCGVKIEIIPGEEEGRCAYLAAKSSLGLGRGSLAVFDTGGGSSQFTFGRGDDVDEQFSVPVGAVRLTEQLGLDRALSEDELAAALHAIAAELSCLDDRPAPDALAGMGGAVTNLTAVKHGLATPPTTPTSSRHEARPRRDRPPNRALPHPLGDERRDIVGLQPNRAEVILAGACVVRTMLTKLGCDAFVVSDRDLRHGLIVARFGLGQPVG
jgi:exopolyphosphatase/guanosine-5'-triphosphate,3'-diphosphate pyrophosphatase